MFGEIFIRNKSNPLLAIDLTEKSVTLIWLQGNTCIKTVMILNYFRPSLAFT